MTLLAVLFSARPLRWATWLYQNRSWLRWFVAATVMLALLGLWRWERHDRLTAEATAQAASEERDRAVAGLNRWKAAVAARDQALAQRDAALAAQSSAIERLRLDANRAEEMARASQVEAERAQSAADARIRAIEEEAHAKPEDVRDLGPLVLRRVGGLFD